MLHGKASSNETEHSYICGHWIFSLVSLARTKLLTEMFDANHGPVVAKKSGLNGVEVSTILSTLLEESDIPWENSNTVPSLDLSTTKFLREKCTDRGIVSYLIQVDSQWHWRIYERHGLLYDWKIGETVVLNNELPSITTTESLTIAILIEGTENHLIQNLLQHSAVLTRSITSIHSSKCNTGGFKVGDRVGRPFLA